MFGIPRDLSGENILRLLCQVPHKVPVSADRIPSQKGQSPFEKKIGGFPYAPENYRPYRAHRPDRHPHPPQQVPHDAQHRLRGAGSGLCLSGLRLPARPAGGCRQGSESSRRQGVERVHALQDRHHPSAGRDQRGLPPVRERQHRHQQGRQALRHRHRRHRLYVRAGRSGL